MVPKPQSHSGSEGLKGKRTRKKYIKCSLFLVKYWLVLPLFDLNKNLEMKQVEGGKPLTSDIRGHDWIKTSIYELRDKWICADG